MLGTRLIHMVFISLIQSEINITKVYSERKIDLFFV